MKTLKTEFEHNWFDYDEEGNEFSKTTTIEVEFEIEAADYNNWNGGCPGGISWEWDFTEGDKLNRDQIGEVEAYIDENYSGLMEDAY